MTSVIRLTEESPLISIVVRQEDVGVTLADGKGFTLHISKGYPLDLAKKTFPFDVMISIALALKSAGHYGIAAQLIAEYANESKLALYPEITCRLAHCLAKAQRVIEALHLSERLLEEKNKELRYVADLVFVMVFSKSSSMNASESEFYKEFLKRRIERAEEHGSQIELAVAHYNLGNHLRGRNRWQALSHYRKAAVHDPNYAKTSHLNVQS